MELFSILRWKDERTMNARERNWKKTIRNEAWNLWKEKKERFCKERSFGDSLRIEMLKISFVPCFLRWNRKTRDRKNQR